MPASCVLHKTHDNIDWERMIAELSKLIVKDIFGCLSESDKKRLSHITTELHIDSEEYMRMKQRVISKDANVEQLGQQPVKHTTIKHTSIRRSILKYAAILLLPLGVATYFIVDNAADLFKDSDSLMVQGGVDEMMLVPERKQPQLILDNGTVVNLATDGTESVVAENIVNSGNSISYAAGSQSADMSMVEVKPQAIRYNTILVPEGGDYKVILSDGSTVWLNENSELKYPVAFGGDMREVQLIKGEMYFDVCKDASHPFVVHTCNGDIRVLGTQFNIASSTAKVVTATLVEGSVEVTSGSHRVTLKPNQQAVVNDKTAGIEVAELQDTEEFTCWKDNIFYFNNKTLEYILEKVATWYGFEVQYAENQIKGRRYYVYVDKYSNMKTILSSISNVSDLKFRVEEGVIMVY